ncbi:MAG: hypothetical protein AB1349_01040 [Elusimicrobiota bacterium]
MKKLKIGFTYDAKSNYKLKSGDLPDKYAEFDTDETISEIETALKSSGHKIEKIGDAHSLLKKIVQDKKWDLVFNIAEGLNSRNREAQVPTILELFGIPYSGSDALTMALALDKPLAKIIVSYYGVLTPKFLEIENIAQLNKKKFSLQYPVIVKLTQEGTSKGLSDDSVCRDFNQLVRKIQSLIEKYNQPVLIEEFVAGSEFTVAVIENTPPVALPPVQTIINGRTFLGNDFYTYNRVANNEIEYICPCKISTKLCQKLKTVALTACKALKVKDLGRVDIRVDEKDTVYFLECNPLPNLGCIDIFPLVAKAIGITYNEIICRILTAALKRNELCLKN